MLEVYQYDADGYYAGPVAMPNNTTPKAPAEKEGFIPRWNGTTWEQVEDHKGKTGWIGREPFTVTAYGPLPEGYSETPPEPTGEEKALAIRAERDSLLAATDHLTMPDYPISEESREQLAVYRQALRDISKQPGFPDEVVWPEKPKGV